MDILALKDRQMYLIFLKHFFYFFVTDVTQHKATSESDLLTTLEILTWTYNAFLTETIKRNNNKQDIISSLGTANFLFGTIFDLTVCNFVTISSFFDDHA